MSKPEQTGLKSVEAKQFTGAELAEELAERSDQTELAPTNSGRAERADIAEAQQTAMAADARDAIAALHDPEDTAEPAPGELGGPMINASMRDYGVTMSPEEWGRAMTLPERNLTLEQKAAELARQALTEDQATRLRDNYNFHVQSARKGVESDLDVCREIEAKLDQSRFVTTQTADLEHMMTTLGIAPDRVQAVMNQAAAYQQNHELDAQFTLVLRRGADETLHPVLEPSTVGSSRHF